MSTAKMVNRRSTSTTVQTDLREGGKERGRERGKKGGRKGEREEGRDGEEGGIPHDLHRSSTTNMSTCNTHI